ncbi:hypothetical protein ZOSMA_93G00250 [Zostera marina]|uniref:Uncharacterized protein n=1 Tax=Zostera marina TaxID=29655 RepID=A0A0K9NIH2_ZOSMR|nr:hypothetical protein ZOSMA_93G00250 [Zostera marina]
MSGVLKKVRNGFGNRTEEVYVPDGNVSLGILAFETAKTMSRLLSLHRALSDSEIKNLRTKTFVSPGVQYLNSRDHHFLFQLAAAEMVDQLDRVAEAITRLSKRSGRKAWPREFNKRYVHLKNGDAMELHLGFSTKEMEKKMKKMEKYSISTSKLHQEMETLAEMEASEKKLNNWKHSGPLTPTGPVAQPASSSSVQGENAFLKKMALQRKKVNKIKEESLWKKSYEKVTVLMGKATITIFCKICEVFNKSVIELPDIVLQRDGRYRFLQNRNATQTGYNENMNSIPRKYCSGPLERPLVSGASYIESSDPLVHPPIPAKLYRRNSRSFKRLQLQAGAVFHGNSGPLFNTTQDPDTKSWVANTLEPGRNTVGSSGMAIRYAEVVAALEMMLLVPETVGDEARIELYRMLPTGMQKAVNAKLKKKAKAKAVNRGESDGDDELMAEGWRDAALDILKWLGPMAKDTSTWQSERTCERKKLFDEDEKVFILQTLFFSDKEKAEAAIVEVLVGLSCVCKYGGGRGDDNDEDWY